VFEDLYARHADSAARPASATPPGPAALMAALAAAGGPAAAVLDPSCGPGDLLLAAQRAGCGTAALAGQDADPGLARLAAVRLAFAARAGARAGDAADPLVAEGDALRHDAWPRLQADAVLCNPPFNDRNWGHEDLAYDPRWEYGLPPKTEGELAWVQHALAHVRPGGAVAMLMPPAVAARGSGRRIRAELLRSGALRAVIGLPAGAAPPAGIALQIWLLARPGSGTAASAHVLFVDTAGAPGPADPGRRDIDWDAVTALAVESWQAFRADPASCPQLPGVRRSVPVIDLLDDSVDLTPAHNLPLPAGADSAALVADTRGHLVDAIADLPGLIPATDPADPGRATWRMVAIADLARGGAVSLHRGPVRPGRTDPEAGGSSEERVLTAADVTSGSAPSGAWPAADDSTAQATRVQAGDVVVPAVFAADGTSVRVADDADAGALLGANLHLLRPDPQVLDPWFLAGFLSAPANTRQATYGSSIVRLDVRRFEVPLLPVDAQRRYAEAFRALYAYNTALRRVARQGALLAAGLLDGLTSGVLEPKESAQRP
ncbi:N-6 DNA methylase, partial [Yinghuangia soli]